MTTSVLAHGGTAGLAIEISLLALPLVGFAMLWWWNRRLSRQGPPDAASPDAGTADREVDR